MFRQKEFYAASRLAQPACAAIRLAIQALAAGLFFLKNSAMPKKSLKYIQRIS